MAGYGYYQAKDVIESGQPYSLESVATAWRNFAEALRNASAHTQGTSDKVTEQYGTPYQAFGDRAAPMANWMTGVSTNADAVASGLSNASTTGSSAQMTMYQEDYQYGQDVDRIVGPEGALSVGRINAIERREAQAATVLNGEIDKWSAAYNAFQPGAIGSAPTTTGPGGNPHVTSTGTGTGGTTRTGGTDGPSQLINTGGTHDTGGTDDTAVGGGKDGSDGATDFPHSSVIGDDGGDFAGWVKDPRTGFLIDPTTGQEFDPTTGRWIDPVTGKPFGDVVQYASRLEGLNGGGTSGLLGTGGGNVGTSPLFNGVGGSGGGLAGMYGGVLPPSMAANNPAANQLRQNAADSMAAKAYAAQQLAMKEAAQGGRPYLPPTQAGMAGGMPGGGRAGGGRGSRLVTEPAGTWTNRAGRRGAAGEEPLLSGGRGAGRRGGRAGAGLAGEEPLLGGTSGRNAAGRAGARGRTPTGEPFEEGMAGGRAGRGTGAGTNRSSYLPPMQGGQAGNERDRKRKRPDWLVEDDVWSVNQNAGPAVLGED
jgi:hypothetical protein